MGICNGIATMSVVVTVSLCLILCWRTEIVGKWLKSVS